MIKAHIGSIRCMSLPDGTELDAVEVDKNSIANVIALCPNSDLKYNAQNGTWTIDQPGAYSLTFYYNDWLIIGKTQDGKTFRFKLSGVAQSMLYTLRGTDSTQETREIIDDNTCYTFYAASMYNLLLPQQPAIPKLNNSEFSLDIADRGDCGFMVRMDGLNEYRHSEVLFIPKNTLSWVLVWTTTRGKSGKETYDPNSLCYIPTIVWKHIDDIALVLN